MADPEPIPPDWANAEKFYWMDGAMRIIAERAMDYNVITFRLVKADDQAEIDKYKDHYNGAVPMLIASARYFCFYKLVDEAVG